MLFCSQFWRLVSNWWVITLGRAIFNPCIIVVYELILVMDIFMRIMNEYAPPSYILINIYRYIYKLIFSFAEDVPRYAWILSPFNLAKYVCTLLYALACLPVSVYLPTNAILIFIIEKLIFNCAKLIFKRYI